MCSRGKGEAAACALNHEVRSKLRGRRRVTTCCSGPLGRRWQSSPGTWCSSSAVSCCGELVGLLCLAVFLVIGEERFQGVVAEVALADEPFVVLLDDDAGGEPDQRFVVGEDADDVGAAADLAVRPPRS
jgi:hypothetical protein